MLELNGLINYTRLLWYVGQARINGCNDDCNTKGWMTTTGKAGVSGSQFVVNCEQKGQENKHQHSPLIKM